MAHWDTSALLKLFLAENDSSGFSSIAAEGSDPVTVFIARHELQAAFVRREGEGALQVGLKVTVSPPARSLCFDRPRSFES